MAIEGAFEPQQQQYAGTADEWARVHCWRCAEAQDWHCRHYPAADRVNWARCPEHKPKTDH